MSNSWLIRSAAQSDFEEVNRLLVLLGYDVDESQKFDRKKVFESILLNENQKVFVVHSSDQKSIHALISYSVLPQLRLSGLKMEIDELVVSPEKRGSGLGSELIKFVMMKAREMKVKKIIVSTNKNRESYKRSFYKKLGFVEKNSAFFEYSFLK